jgi:energy-coupling factor transport system substrate-specific component
VKTFLRILEPISLIVVLVILVLCAVFNVRGSALLTVIVALLSFVPFAVGFEKRRPRPADIMPIVVMSAIAVVGRVIMTPIPNFQPVSALVIFTGIFFGRSSGYLTGAFTALVSDMMLGMGPWMPWQMYAWGVMGYFAGLLAEKGVFGNVGGDSRNVPSDTSDCAKSPSLRGAPATKQSNGLIITGLLGFARNDEFGIHASSHTPASPCRTWLVYGYGILASALYGSVLDTWYIIGFVSNVTPAAIAAAYVAGLSMNIMHIASTVIFLTLTFVPWRRKISRIKTKYGI